jgi:hypothetical protein
MAIRARNVLFVTPMVALSYVVASALLNIMFLVHGRQVTSLVLSCNRWVFP